MTSDHRVAGSSPAGCMPHPETLMSHPLNARNLACALLVLFYDSDGVAKGESTPYNGTRVRIPLGSLIDLTD